MSRLLTHDQQQLLFYLRDNEMPATQSTCFIEITEGPEEVILVLCVIFKFVSAFDTFLIDLVYEADVYLVCVETVPFTVLLVVYEDSLVIEEDIRDS